MLSRSQLVERAREAGADALPYHVEYLVRNYKFTPAPQLMGGVRIYVEAHVAQLVDYCRNRARRPRRGEQASAAQAS